MKCKNCNGLIEKVTGLKTGFGHVRGSMVSTEYKGCDYPHPTERKRKVTSCRGRDGMYHNPECRCEEAKREWDNLKNSVREASVEYWDGYDAMMKKINDCPVHGKDLVKP